MHLNSNANSYATKSSNLFDYAVKFKMVSIIIMDFKVNPCFKFLQENVPLIAPWMLGVILFMSIEGICTVYANVLRDHINGVSALKTHLSSGFSLKLIFIS